MISKIASFLLIVVLLCGCIHLPSTAAGSSKVPSVGAAASGSPAQRAIQTAVNYTATLSILGGLACLAFGGLAIYGGQIVPGIKLVLAGILLPIAGIWWSYHWLWVTIFVLIGLAVYLLITHYALIRPALVAIEDWAKTVEARIIPAAPVVVPSPAAPLPAPPHPATTALSGTIVAP